jgi:protein ImuB
VNVMKRILCIWLPNWPIQRLVVARPELKGRAVILHARQGSRGQRVAACSPAASAVGVRREMPLAWISISPFGPNSFACG